VAKRATAARKPSGTNPAPFAAPAWVAMKPELWPLDRIKPYPGNPRTHPPEQIELLAVLMKKHGVDQPIVVDELGEILKGHGRRLAAAEAEFTHFPVVQHHGLSEAEKKAMRIADNQTALLSGWDRDLIRSDLVWLKSSGYEMKLLGFGDAQLVQFQTVPGPPEAFPGYTPETMNTKHECPKCGYKWSGQGVLGDKTTVAKRARRKKAAKKSAKKK